MHPSVVLIVCRLDTLKSVTAAIVTPILGNQLVIRIHHSEPPAHIGKMILGNQHSTEVFVLDALPNLDIES